MDVVDRARIAAGVRASVRAQVEGRPSGPDPAELTDHVGIILALDASTLTLERRDGNVITLPRTGVVAARVVPLVARGRNPHHFAPDQVRRLAHDARVGGEGDVWVGRLSDLVDTLASPGVTDGDPARYRSSAARVFGEWATIRLASPGDLLPLAAWAARRDARNVAVTGAADGVRGLARL